MNVITKAISNVELQTGTSTIGGPKMSGNFVRERQRIVYIYNIHVYYTCKQYVAARARNFQTFLGRLCFDTKIYL